MKKASSNALVVAKILRKLRLKNASKRFNAQRHERISESLSVIFEKIYTFFMAPFSLSITYWEF